MVAINKGAGELVSYLFWRAFETYHLMLNEGGHGWMVSGGT